MKAFSRWLMILWKLTRICSFSSGFEFSCLEEPSELIDIFLAKTHQDLSFFFFALWEGKCHQMIEDPTRWKFRFSICQRFWMNIHIPFCAFFILSNFKKTFPTSKKNLKKFLQNFSGKKNESVFLIFFLSQANKGPRSFEKNEWTKYQKFFKKRSKVLISSIFQKKSF